MPFGATLANLHRTGKDSDSKIKTSVNFTIPLFHWTSQGRLHRFGVKSTPDPLGSDSFLFEVPESLKFKS
jgi:hypothetical protein